MNTGTLVVLLALLLLVGAIIFSLLSKKKKGISTCSCGCSGCSGGDCCSSFTANGKEYGKAK